MTNKLRETEKKSDTVLVVLNTKTMTFEQRMHAHRQQDVEYVEHFQYLGNYVCRDGDMKYEQELPKRHLSSSGYVRFGRPKASTCR